MNRSFPSDGELPNIRWRPHDSWLHADGAPNPARQILEGELEFVGLKQSVGFPPDWKQEGCPLLWQYHLHYHSFLGALDFADAKQVVLDYLLQQTAHKGAVGWQAYPLSLRLQSWIGLFFGRCLAQTQADPKFCASLWLEIRRMVRWLEKNLETHLQANHLFENALALSLAGACFDGDLAASWRQRGYALLHSQLAEQILADGGHYERSPMYQQRVLYGLALLIQTNDAELLSLCKQPAQRMAAWLQAMTHPDGGIALFNDSGLNAYPDTQRLCDFLAAMTVPVPTAKQHHATILPESGYFVARNELGDALFMDVGEIGPDHQPGHAHADFLAIEVSLGGKRLIVDGGNFDYLESPERAWARSVEAHSTVFVPGHQPLELWGAFRIGRRGYPMDVRFHQRGSGNNGDCCQASHSGYAHLPGRPTPHRKSSFLPSGLIHLEDSVSSKQSYPCLSQLRIDADWKLTRRASGRIQLQCEDQNCWILGSGEIESTDCQWFPDFGKRKNAHLLRQALVASEHPAPLHWLICRNADLPAAEKIMQSLQLDGEHEL